MKIFILLGLLLALRAPDARACSAFCLSAGGDVVVGKSYDWFFGHGHGMVLTNLRGTRRFGMNLDDSPNPARWEAKFGSLTFTQFGRGFPVSGIN